MTAAFAQPKPMDLTGVYQYEGNLRNATVSKLEIKSIKGQYHIHVWFYGRPEDVDWGEVPATEYQRTGFSPRTRDLMALLQHGDSKATVIVRVNNGAEKASSITAQSWVTYAHPDERHPNEVADDMLNAKK
jgi:hypothetical protein